MVRVATVSFLMEDAPHTVEQNLTRARNYIMRAAELEAQIVCLPETLTTNQVEDPLAHVGETEKWIECFSTLALETGMDIIAPFYVLEGSRIYNQATVFDGEGRVIGRYRKLQPTGIEAKRVTAGSDLPIIDLGFAKIGIMICMDIYFPEIARIYAMKGADMLFWPTVAHGPTQSGLEAQLRSRAIDNSIHIIESNLAGHPPYAPYKGRFYPGTGRILDFNGDVIAQTGRREGVAVADIDLSERRTTADCVLIHDPDDTRADLEALARMDLYAREYAELARQQRRFYDTLSSQQST